MCRIESNRRVAVATNRSYWNWLAPVAVVPVVLWLTGWAASHPVLQPFEKPWAAEGDDLQACIDRVDGFFARRWKDAGVEPAPRVDELRLLRRLALEMQGTVPSLEEIRRFEGDSRPDRLRHWTSAMLRTKRCSDYFAERLARGLVGVENGQFIVFRRDRFVTWLSDELRENRPWDELARTMISERGLWTGNPAANFVTAAVNDGDVDENKLAGKTVRAFLGQRMDCAQCHDHPFAEWKQKQFEGLASLYGQTRLSPVGVEDDTRLTWEVEDRMTLEKRKVAPAAPFHPEWLPEDGSRRERLAAWVTHAENRRFERAIVNRVWGLMFGRPWHEPVDDLPNPSEPADLQNDLLDILGADFRAHGCDLHRLIRIIAATRAFQQDSIHPALESGEGADRVEAAWAAYPLTRLRPEQIIGCMLQSASLQTIDQNSHFVTRTLKFFRQNDFVKEYGDVGADELTEHSGTIPQALVRMNGRFARELVEAGPLSASGRLASLAATDDSCIDGAFLACFTRRPTEEEQTHFRTQLNGIQSDERTRVVEDLYWTLFNSPEFSWNH